MTRAEDQTYMAYALIEVLRIAKNGLDLSMTPTFKCLEWNTIKCFYADLLVLDDESLKELEYPEIAEGEAGHDTSFRKLSPLHTTKLRSLIAFYHHHSFIEEGEIDLKKYTHEDYAKFRGSEYSAGIPIIPWRTRIKQKIDAERKELLDIERNWQKNTRLSLSDFKEHRDDLQWVKYHKTLENLLTAG